MSKKSPIYTCTHCDAQYIKWQGRCTECSKWNTIEESVRTEAFTAVADAAPLQVRSIKDISVKDAERTTTGIKELDAVLGGGFVAGSIVLLGGEPGIGKSTLSLQIACSKSLAKKKILYVSAEESASQIKLRADRLAACDTEPLIVSATDLGQIMATIKKEKPELVVIDSVQTVSAAELPAGAGSVTQVRFITEQFLTLAKSLGITVILLGHVTKAGVVAGPRTLEHLVDAVLYLEGNRYENFRILRGVKNRFGATGKVGVFEMKKNGLVEVKDPSGVFLHDQAKNEPGSAVFVTLEGNRAFLGVMQALAAQTQFGYPKRTASGFDLNRLQLLVAVLSKKGGLELDDQDIYLKTVGGLKVDDPGVDLPVCLAVASSFLDKPIDPKLIAVGEVGLAGEIRLPMNVKARLQEAEKLGFKKVLVAPKSELMKMKSKLEIIQVETISEAIKKVLS